MLKAIVTDRCMQFCIFYCRQPSLNTTNLQADNIITNYLFRLAVQLMKCNQRTSFEKQHQRVCDELAKSPISKGSETLALGFNTIISQEFMRAHRTATLSHLQRISDYLELGPGTWYNISDNGSIEFFDGDAMPRSLPQGPRLSHYRY